MKKMFSVCLALMLLLALALPALAENGLDTLDGSGESAGEAAADAAEDTEAILEDGEDTVDDAGETAEEALEAIENAADTGETVAEEASEEEAESWMSSAFEDFKETEWYVYVVIGVLAVIGIIGLIALGKKTAGTHMNTRVMVEGAMMIAVATVLSMIKIVHMPFGGSVTLFSMLPIVLMSYRHGTMQGLLTAFAFSLLRLVMGISNLGYCATLGAQIACVLLDYVIAFTVLGLASAISRPIRNRTVGVLAGTAAVCAMRFICHFLSGIFLWGSYQEYYDWAAGMPTWLYSLVYNGNYMLLETIITVVGAVILVRGAARLFDRQAD